MQLLCTGLAAQTLQVTIIVEPSVLPHSLHAPGCVPEQQEIEAVSARLIGTPHETVMGHYCMIPDHLLHTVVNTSKYLALSPSSWLQMHHR